MRPTNYALSSEEKSNREDLRSVLHAEREAQKERDALWQEKLSAVVELEVAKRDSERWKAAAEKAEWMINHQLETITQLRREAQQWKDQFMRVEEERLRLSGRNDELVSQLLHASRRENTYQQEPLTQQSKGSQISDQAKPSNQDGSASPSAMGCATTDDNPNRSTPREQPYTHIDTPRAEPSRNVNTNAHTKSQPVVSSLQPGSHSNSTATTGKVLRVAHGVIQDRQVKEESPDSVVFSAPESNTGFELFGKKEEVEEKAQPTPNQSQKQKLKHGRLRAPYTTDAERREKLEADLRVDVRGPYIVTCRICGKDVKLSKIVKYSPSNWKTHIEKCEERQLGGMNSYDRLRAPHTTDAERREKLEADPRVDVCGPHLVTCRMCGKKVKLHKVYKYCYTRWRIHVEGCGKRRGMNIVRKSDKMSSGSLSKEEMDEGVQPPPPIQSARQKLKQVAGKRKAGQSARRNGSEDRRIYGDDVESGSETSSVENEDECIHPARPHMMEDEHEVDLMLGGKVNRHETYGAEKIRKEAHAQPPMRSSGSVRKRNSPHPPTTSKTESKIRRLR